MPESRNLGCRASAQASGNSIFHLFVTAGDSVPHTSSFLNPVSLVGSCFTADSSEEKIRSHEVAVHSYIHRLDMFVIPNDSQFINITPNKH